MATLINQSQRPRRRTEKLNPSAPPRMKERDGRPELMKIGQPRGGGKANEKQEEMKMDNELIDRMHKAIKRIGGSLAILNLPNEVKEIITNCPDYETRVKMLELVCEQLGK